MLGLGLAKKIGLGKIVEKLILKRNNFILKKKLYHQSLEVKKRNKQKVFVIGFNKTGTTSLGYTLEKMGYIVANQMQGELLFDCWLNNKYQKIFEYCRTAEVFQDAPFSFPETYLHLDNAFPNSKFILTIRDSPEQWYQSLISFHGKMWGKGNVPPTYENLKEANYIYKGFPYISQKQLFKTPDNDLYHKKTLIDTYTNHQKAVENYFIDKPQQLLTINIANANDFKKLCNFVNINPPFTNFPHISSTKIASKEYECNFLKS